jgi:1,4-dihydroxy-6-naphthoate synthase
VRNSLRWAYAHDDEAFDLCRQHAQDLTPSVIRSHIELYVNEYSDDLGPDGEAAVAFFLEQQRLAAAWRK